jgi:hypothetical protein
MNLLNLFNQNYRCRLSLNFFPHSSTNEKRHLKDFKLSAAFETLASINVCIVWDYHSSSRDISPPIGKKC